MFEVDLGHVGVRADLFVVVEDDEAGVDHVRLLVPPVERFQVVVVLLLVGPDEVVFVDLLPRLFIAQRTEHPVLLGRCCLLCEVLPLFELYVGGFEVD